MDQNEKRFLVTVGNSKDHFAAKRQSEMVLFGPTRVMRTEDGSHDQGESLCCRNTGVE